MVPAGACVARAAAAVGASVAGGGGVAHGAFGGRGVDTCAEVQGPASELQPHFMSSCRKTNVLSCILWSSQGFPFWLQFS